MKKRVQVFILLACTSVCAQVQDTVKVDFATVLKQNINSGIRELNS